MSVVCSPKKCLPWQDKKGIFFIDPESILGQSLSKVYNRSVVVIWQKEGERVVLAPDVSEKEAARFILDWQNYHAVDTP